MVGRVLLKERCDDRPSNEVVFGIRGVSGDDEPCVGRYGIDLQWLLEGVCVWR